MKKILTVFLALFILTGCDFAKNINNTPNRKVEDFLNKYQRLDSEVLKGLDDVIEHENILNKEQSEAYRKLMKKHYQDLVYEIKNEKEDGDNAIVTVEVEVTDYSKAITEANKYIQNNPEKFKDEEGNFDENLFNQYKIDEMEKVTERIKYTIDFQVKKVEKEWKVQPLSDKDLDKIHGIYMH